ncbi:MAG TPA: DPP IV N-terminal domain-containing protein, partial [Draconibacterium sp.]|nr:DPP IV N-terminal domain-containing protein [Draconibacterium sp.]
MRKILIIFLLIAQVVVAQQKQMTLEDAIIGRYSYLNPEKLEGLSWKNEITFTFLKNDTLWAESAKDGEKLPVTNRNELNEIIQPQTQLQLRRFPEYEWEKNGNLLLHYGPSYVMLNPLEKKVEYTISIPPKAENAVFNEPGKFVAFTMDENLYAVFPHGKIVKITGDGGNGIVNGKSVHRNEFGITGGIFNSPKGNYIAFYRKDESMVKDYPLVDFMTREAEYTPVKYPMAGMTSHQVKLGVYNISTGKTVFMKTGKPLDHYLTNIAWSPDEKSIYIAELNREQNHMQMNCYNAESGVKVKTLFEETNDRYVEPLYPVVFSKVNENEFYYLTR